MAEATYPYDVLAKYGIRPDSPVETVQIEEKDNFKPGIREEIESWRVLRSLSSRLKVDFFLYWGPDKNQLVELQDYLESARELPSAADIRNLLGENAPVILILAGHRDEARHLCEELLSKNPTNSRISHYLALLFYSEAKHYEESADYDRANDLWKQTIAHWTRVLADDSYWNAWCCWRQSVYGKRHADYLSDPIKAAVRLELQQYLTNEFSFYADSYWSQDNQTRTNQHRSLEICYICERHGSAALGAAGGLRLKDNQTLVCGRLLLRQLGLQHLLSELVAEVQNRLDAYQKLDTFKALESESPSISSEVCDLLRFYFSDLAESAALVSIDKSKEAIDELSSIPVAIEDFEQRNPSYACLILAIQRYRRDIADLTIRAQMSISRRQVVLAPPNLSAIKSIWRDVINEGCAASIEGMAAKAISDLVLARIDYLKDDQSRPEIERQNEAVAILEIASAVSDIVHKSIVSALVEALSYRGWARFNNDTDYPGAVSDLRRAFELYPNHPRMREEFCQMLINYADHRIEANQKAMATSMLEQAKRVAEQGLQTYPDNESLKMIVQNAERDLDILNGKVIRDEETEVLGKALEKLKKQNGAGNGTPGQSAGRHLQQAMSEIDKEHYFAAIRYLRLALDSDPNHAITKSLLVDACWKSAIQSFDEAAEDGEPTAIMQTKETVQLGLTYNAGHSGLLVLQKQIELVEKLLGDLSE